MPPIWIAIDEKFAKPHSAYVMISAVRGVRAAVDQRSVAATAGSIALFEVTRA